ncbi:MAG: fluoride efflux transporter CrcB [Actinobacteria bacterium]|nr:fluoride efflux transporter CrcB [Actinomycetota bacterium]MBV8958747.1 fluoride efflux transporter CrcB [Actinomycetota bacterium]
MGLAVAVGGAGAVGAVARYLVDTWVRGRTRTVLPIGTLVVNVIGSFILGVLAGLAIGHAGTVKAKTIVGTGFCGGLTTWSTAAWETVRLAGDDSRRDAVVFTVANLALSFCAAAVGLLLTLP